MNLSESVGIDCGSEPNFLKMASAATGMKGVKKCASAYTASSRSRQQACRNGNSSLAFIFHGSRSAIHLLVAPQATMVCSAISANLYELKALSVFFFSSARSKGGDTRLG